MKNRKGFTIVELVIVIAVIAILAAVLIPTFSGVVQKANESASLQTATSAMKTVLAQSSSATIADGTYFIVGNKAKGAQNIYKYTNNKMGTENLLSSTASENILYGDKVTGTDDKLNTVILPVKENTSTPDNGEATIKILQTILGKTDLAEANIVSVPTEKSGLTESKWAAIQALPTNAKYYVNIDFDETDDDDTNKTGVFYVAVITNVDFAEGTVVFTYSK